MVTGVRRCDCDVDIGATGVNVLGLIDILFVVATATRIALGDPGALAPLLRLPLSVLPTWLVPLIIASHVILAVRLMRPREPYGALAA